MPKITVKTTPIKGRVTIWRVNPSGMMTLGPAPQSAYRVHPWPFAIGLEPVVINGVLWVPEINQERDMLFKDETRTYRYINMGKI
jgi:hypothetical protein